MKLNATRILGATGIEVPLIGYGTAPLGKEDVSRAHAERCLNHAIDSGVTYFDTSPDYGSEPHVGAVMKTRRDEVFLATKVNRRSRDGARRDLEESLEKLQTDHIDLIQVHAVNTWADWEQVIAPDGVLSALETAREEGLVRFIGITGHARPEILGHALESYDFDTVLVALGIADRLVSSPETFVLPRAQNKNMGVVAMKVFGHGAYDNRALALRYSLGLPQVSLAILGLDDTHQIDEAIALANNFQPLNEDEREQLVEEVRPIIERESDELTQEGESTLFWLHDTGVMGWAKDDEPILVRY